MELILLQKKLKKSHLLYLTAYIFPTVTIEQKLFNSELPQKKRKYTGVSTGQITDVRPVHTIPRKFSFQTLQLKHIILQTLPICHVSLTLVCKEPNAVSTNIQLKILLC